MSIEAISFLPASIEPSVAPAAGAETGVPSARFADWFGQQLTEVNSQLVNADHGLQQLATGEATNLHQVMINLEEAKLSLQLLAQVRNRLLDAYQEVMRMQV